MRYTSIGLSAWSLRRFLDTHQGFGRYFDSIPNDLYGQNMLLTPEIRGKIGQNPRTGFPEAIFLSLCSSDLRFSLSEHNRTTTGVVPWRNERMRMSESRKSDPVSLIIEWSCVPGCTPYHSFLHLSCAWMTECNGREWESASRVNGVYLFFHNLTSMIQNWWVIYDKKRGPHKISWKSNDLINALIRLMNSSSSSFPSLLLSFLSPFSFPSLLISPSTTPSPRWMTWNQ